MKSTIGVGGLVLVAVLGCAGDRAGGDPPIPSDSAQGSGHPSSAVTVSTPALPASGAPLTSAAPSAATKPPSRLATEWGEYTLAIVGEPSDVSVLQLSSSGFVDPSTEDFNDKRVGGFPVASKWPAPKSADFGSRLSAILRDDKSYDFDIVTRCAPNKGVIGLVIRHKPKCDPNDTCALDVVHVVLNFPCHQIFVTTRVSGAGGLRGKSWGAHFGPAKDALLDLLSGEFPDKASVLKTLR